MRVRAVFKFWGFFMVIISLWMTVPLAYAVFTGGRDAPAFAAAIGVGVLVSAIFYLLGSRSDMSEMRVREASLAVTLAWVLASVVGGLPFYLCGAAPSFIDSYFEAMSGFTTTGATILDALYDTPRGLILWRAMMHWLGGMGIILFALTVMPIVGGGGGNLFMAEVPGIDKEKFTPRVRDTAIILWGIYAGLTATLMFVLLAWGMSLYDAVTHAMGTISTGGFSPYNESLLYFDSVSLDWIIIFFMFISGVNFSLHFRAFRGKTLQPLLRDSEFLFYTGLVVTFSLAIALKLWTSGFHDTFAECLRRAAFQVVSFVTTTGFVSDRYEVWPFFAQAMLFLCLSLGGCAGSTSGGIKQIRVLTFIRVVTRQVKSLLHPRAILRVRIGSKSAGIDSLSSTTAFFGLYMIVFAVGIFGVTLFEGDFFTAISGAAATLGNVGPGFGTLGAAGNFAGQAAPAKIIYSFLMLCGRLELFTVMVLFTRSFWSEGLTFRR